MTTQQEQQQRGAPPPSLPGSVPPPSNSTTILFPHEQRRASVEDELRRLSFTGNGARAAFRGKILSYDAISDSIQEEPQRDATHYMSGVNLDEAGESCRHLMRRHRQTADLQECEFTAALPGTTFQLPDQADPESINVACVSDKTGSNYFDLVVYLVNEQTREIVGQLAYNHKNVNSPEIGTMYHSGDVDSLLQFVTGLPTMQPGIIAVVCAVGYTRRPLRFFADQVPTVCICINGIIYIVPCPLEPAIIGENNIATLAIIRNKDGALHVSIPTTPGTASGVNTGDMSPVVTQLVLAAIDASVAAVIPDAADLAEAGGADRGSAEESKCAEQSLDSAGGAVAAPPPTSQVLFGVQAGIRNLVPIPGSLPLTFGRGLSPYDPQSSRSQINIPFCEWCAEYIALLAGQTSTLPVGWEQIHNVQAAIVHVSPNDWTDGLRGATFSHLLNALFVVHPTIPDGLALDTPAQIQSFLNGMGKNFMVMAGRFAIVIVQIGDQYYWYSGPRWTGLTADVPPAFGDKVPGIIDRFEEWATDGEPKHPVWDPYTLPFDWMSIYKNLLRQILQNNDAICEIQNTTTSGQDAHEAKQAELGQLNDQNQELTYQMMDLVQQMQILGAIEMTKARSSMLTELESAQKSQCTAIDAKIGVLSKLINLETIVSNPEFVSQLKSLKEAKRTIERSFNPLMDAINQLFSSRGSSTRGHSVKAAFRRQAVQNNVADATKIMKDRPKFAQFLGETGDHCVVVVRVPSHNLLQTIAAVNAGIPETLPASGLTLLPHCPQVDDSTGEALVLTVPVNGRKDPLENSLLSMPERGGSNESALLIPINGKMMVECKNPGSVDWSTLTNEPMYAWVRIALRGAFSGHRESQFPPQSQYLGYALIDSLVALMESICAPLIEHERTVEFGDTTAEILRGLACHLLALMASGSAKPLCPLYLIVNDHCPIPNVSSRIELDWIIRMVQTFKFTGWDTTTLLKNAEKILIRSLRRSIDKVTNPLRLGVGQQKKNRAQKQLDRRNAELHWCAIIAKVLTDLHASGESLTSEHAARLLDFAPPDTSTKSRGDKTPFLKRILSEFAKGNKIYIGALYAYMAQMAIKRSAVFKESKKTALLGMSSGSIDFATFKSIMAANSEAVRTSFGGKLSIDQFKMQNSRALTGKDADGNTLDDHHRHAALNGDGETRRNAWSVGGTLKKDDVLMKVSQVLGREFTSESADGGGGAMAASDSAPEQSSEQRLIQHFRESGASSKLIEFVKHLQDENDPSTTFALITQIGGETIPLDRFAELAHLVGIEDVPTFVQTSLFTILEGWRDPVKAEQTILQQNTPAIPVMGAAMDATEGGDTESKE